MEEPIINETIYPPKPEQNEKQQAVGKSLISLGLFILTFYLFFGMDLNNILMLTLALIIHEMGHFIAMKSFGYKDVNMFFVPLLGAYVSGTKHKISQKQNVIMLLAGPVPGIFIGLILSFIAFTIKSEHLFSVANIFIYLNLFNLLPMMPLDGGKIIKAMFFETNEIINTVFVSISILLLIVIFVALKSFVFLIVPYLLIMQLVGQGQTQKARKEIRELGIDLSKSYDELTDREYWMIRDVMSDHIKYYSKLIRKGDYSVSESEDKIISGVSSVLQTSPIKDLGLGGRILIILVGLACFAVPFITTLLYYVYENSLASLQFQF
jgi:stage IV sporulation protein FB